MEQITSLSELLIDKEINYGIESGRCKSGTSNDNVSPVSDVPLVHNESQNPGPSCLLGKDTSSVQDIDILEKDPSITDLGSIIEICGESGVSGIDEHIDNLNGAKGEPNAKTKPNQKSKSAKVRKVNRGDRTESKKMKQVKTTGDKKSKQDGKGPMKKKVKKTLSGDKVKKVNIEEGVPVKILKILPKPQKPYQKFCDIIQVDHTRGGKIHFFSGTIPVFVMSSTVDVLETSNDNDQPVYLLCINEKQIKAVMIDKIISGVYLINLTDHKYLNLAGQQTSKSDQSSWTIKKATLSSYLSSLTDPMAGHHYIIIGEPRNKASGTSFLPALSMDHALMYVSSQIPELETEVEHTSDTKSFPPCDHIHYIRMKSMIEEYGSLNSIGKSKFQLRISYADKSEENRMKKLRRKGQNCTESVHPIS